MILAQVLTAAAQASPDKVVKSLHILFPREGDTAASMRYRVTKLQDGRTFGTTEVVAEQDGKVISAAVLSMHAEEDGYTAATHCPQSICSTRSPSSWTSAWCRETRIVGADKPYGPKGATEPRSGRLAKLALILFGTNGPSLPDECGEPRPGAGRGSRDPGDA